MSKLPLIGRVEPKRVMRQQRKEFAETLLLSD